MLTGPNGVKYNIRFEDETSDVILILPNHSGKNTELRFNSVRDVLDFIGQKSIAQRTA
jgi:hypothetical protein